jgi:Vacuolar sorting protein 9 (VPS9) domain
MIYIFITINAQVPDLFAQIKFMNSFATPFVRTTKLGYCLTTLEIAVTHILNMSSDDYKNGSMSLKL